MIRQNNMKRKAFIFILSLGAALVSTTSVRAAGDSEAEILERIKPIGTVNIAGEPSKPAAAPAPAPKVVEVVEEVVEKVAEVVEEVAAVTETTGRSGEEIYNASCFVCHKVGVAGAPKLGDAGAWGERVAKGMDALLASSISGLNAMPPRGTCADCTDGELKASIQFMIDSSQ